MKKAILVVDDSPIIRKVINFSLSLKGYEIIQVSDGMQALEQLSCDNIDLIITDLNMPNINGYELISTIRENEDFRKTPIIVLSNLSEMEDVERALQCGANSYLVKPFEKDGILQEVSKYIN